MAKNMTSSDYHQYEISISRNMAKCYNECIIRLTINTSNSFYKLDSMCLHTFQGSRPQWIWFQWVVLQFLWMRRLSCQPSWVYIVIIIVKCRNVCTVGLLDHDNIQNYTNIIYSDTVVSKVSVTSQFCQSERVILSNILIFTTINISKCKNNCIIRFIDIENIRLDTKIKILAQLFPKLLWLFDFGGPFGGHLGFWSCQASGALPPKPIFI